MMRPNRRGFLLGALASFALCHATWAATASFAEVTAPVAALDAGLLSIMKAGQATAFPKRYAMLDPVVAASFDLPRILQTAVGFGWSDIPASQKTPLLAVFRQYTVASYVSNFNSYDGQQFRILPNLRAVGALQVVQTEIVRRAKSPAKINYVVRKVGAGWRVVDVLLDGTISQVAVQRSDFHSLLVSGSAIALINALRNKVAKLSGNTIS